MENEVKRAMEFLKYQKGFVFEVQKKHYETAIAALERQGESEQLVRCGNCKKFGKKQCPVFKDISKNDFCSYGEKLEG